MRRPSTVEPHDWEADPRSFTECLKAWRAAHGWTWQETADELREPWATVTGWMKTGREPKNTLPQRRLMTLIDRST